MKIKNGLKIGAMCAIMSFSVTNDAKAAGIPVFDAKSEINFAINLKQLVDQFNLLNQQYNTTKNLYDSMRGERGFADILRNPIMQQHMPADLKNIYDTLNRAEYAGISGTISEIIASEKYDGSVSDGLSHMEERERQFYATNKAVQLTGYDGAQQSLVQISQLIDQIKNTPDAKSIGELQARIQGQATILQAEQMKLSLLQQLQESEEKLINQQKRDMARSYFTNDNHNFPRMSWDGLK